MKRSLGVGLVLAFLMAVLAGPAAADAPTEVPLELEFEDLNACTGEMVTVTMTGVFVVHDHDGRSIVRLPRTITTSDGFEGRGDATEVVNGRISKFTLNDMLTHESGARIRAHYVLVLDLSTSTVLVEKGGVQVCLGP